MAHSIETLLGDTINGGRKKWSTFVDGEDGFLYGIPSDARRVVKFHPNDKSSMVEIGPDLGDITQKWNCGVRARNGTIYCAPYHSECILKIDTIEGTVGIIAIDMRQDLPRENIDSSWMSGVLAKDDMIYYMPTFFAHHILKLNPLNEKCSSVGGDFMSGNKFGRYGGTVLGKDDCIYGLPLSARGIVKFNPKCPEELSLVGDESKTEMNCGNGVLGDDGYIYALSDQGRVLKVDTTNNSYSWSKGGMNFLLGRGWGNPVIGSDKCIYWPPYRANRVLKFDPTTQQLPSLVGHDLGHSCNSYKWLGGTLADDDIIYFIPFDANEVLAIDPFKELLITLKNSIVENPQTLGCLFVKNCFDETFYESAIRKLGHDKVFKLIHECLPLDLERISDSKRETLPLFMIAASCGNGTVPVIDFLLRRNVNDLIQNVSGSIP
jgi:outer membrane protein assembly factor BamB